MGKPRGLEVVTMNGINGIKMHLGSPCLTLAEMALKINRKSVLSMKEKDDLHALLLAANIKNDESAWTCSRVLIYLNHKLPSSRSVKIASFDFVHNSCITAG